MSTALEMSLDDIIKSNKRSSRAAGRSRGSRGGGAAASGGPGPSRRFINRNANRTTPYTTYRPGQGRSPMLVDGGRSSRDTTDTRLFISNLEYGVSNDDIKELFSEVGQLKRYSINYDRSGRSKGTAEVVFSCQADALLAHKKYNNVQLDGKPMKIEVVAPVVPEVVFRNSNGLNRDAQSRGRVAVRPVGGVYGGNRGHGSGRGQGRGRGRGRGDPVSAEALDEDLEKYHKEAMQTE